MKEIVCYTDGACSYNPGPGGFAIVFIKNSEDISSLFYGASEYTTNNRMELTAVVESIKLANAKGYEKITVHSDSAYVVNAILNNWHLNWIRNGWVTNQNKPVKNKDLWLKLINLMKEIKVEVRKVKGHSGERFNEVADKLAVKAIEDLELEKIPSGGVINVNCPENR